MNYDNDIKIIASNDTKELIAAARSGTNNNAGGGYLEDEIAKESIKKALARQGIVEFTDKEIKTMPKTFRRLIIIQKKRCRLRTRQSGKDTITYEIRFRRDGYNVSAHGKTIELAKANFIEKLKTAQPIADKKSGGSVYPSTFNAFALYYFETFKKERVSKLHYDNYLRIFNRHLFPRFKETPLIKITPSDCKTILDEIKGQGKGKTADDLHSILNGIFKSAIAHGLIERNPLALVLHVQHERKNGKALTKTEETRLFEALHGTEYETAAALALYCGLRPNEIETAQIHGDFIKAINSKRKGGKVEYKYIPIINPLRPFLPVDGVFYPPNLYVLRQAFKKALPNHKLYDLRTTFYTRCDELGVAPPARDEFVGHSSGALTNAYRDLSDEYLLKEGEKLNAW